MNVYDFDGTIYNGDSTIDFYLYALKKKPSIIKYVPKQAKGMLLYKMKKISKTRMKEYFYSFLQGIKAESMLESFWKEQESHIYPWYRQQHKKDDVVISASPEFLLWPICQKLEIQNLLASQVDISSGKYEGENCRAQEKVRRFQKAYPHEKIENFYSDSYSDFSLAKLAEQAFFIKKGKMLPWKIES